MYSEARTEWVQNIAFNKCFVHATRGGEAENVEEVTIPVLSLLDDKWCAVLRGFIERMAGDERPWFLYHCTRGVHFDNYPHPDFLGRSPAKHPYKDAVIELDDICGRLIDALQRSGQLESTMVVISSDNGPEMETWPDSAFTPFRCAKGSTWEGGCASRGVVVAGDDRSGGAAATASSTCSTSSRRARRSPAPRIACRPTGTSTPSTRRRSCSRPADEPEVVSNRKFQHYWPTMHFSALRVGEYKYMSASITDDDTDVLESGRFHRVGPAVRVRASLQPVPGPRRSRRDMIRKLVYIDAMLAEIACDRRTFREWVNKAQ